jgi:hypothetical protein
MLTVNGWARRSSIVLVIVICLALILAGCGAGDSPSAGGGLNPTRTVGKKATSKPTVEEEETEEPTEEETEEPTEEETEEPTEEETEEPTEEANTGDATCPLSQEEVEDIVGETVTDMTEAGTADAPQCTYTTESISVVSIAVQDMGSDTNAKLGLDAVKGTYDDVEQLDGVGDDAIIATVSSVPILQGYKGSLLVTLTYFSLSQTDAEKNKQIMIDLATATFDKL